MKIKKNGKFFKSLRFRILIILIILGIVPSVIVTEMVIANYEDRAIANRVQSMENICDIMCDLLIKENYLNDTSSQTVNSKLELLSNSYGGRILIVDRDFRIIKDTYGVDEGRTLVSQKVLNCFRGEDAYRYDSDSQKLILAVPVKSPDVKQVQGAMMIMASSSEVTATIHELEQKGILIIGIIVVLAIFLGYILSTILVKPFARVTKAIEDLTDGYQNEEISVPDYTETALITDAFNKMLSRMKTLDESRQEFVSNVSHELKTPMTSMKVLADSLVGQQGVPEELYQEFLSDITEEIDRENKIITDLLSLVKMDKKAADMNITNMNINELLENILKRLRPIADQRRIDLILDSFRPVTADVDEVKFTLAISNLVENGIKYNVDEGWVRVTLDADHKDFYVTVADSGLGIPEDSIERIFERFYRVDKSHSREIGGTGLGPISRPRRYSMKKTILIICVAAACILLGLVAFIGLSGRNKNEEQQYRFYYINSDETRLKEEKYTPEKETTEVMLRNFSESLNNRETRENGISLFPEGVKISSYSIQDGVLNIEFDEAYDKMSRTRELLVRAGIVKIFLQVPGVESVEICVGKKPLTDTRGEEVGAMNNDTFVEFSGSDGDVYSYDTFTLYFTNKNGDKLVAEQRSVRYRRNLPKATVVLEQLARGPLEKGHYPTIPENSEVLSLTRANGICYVDYNSVFQDYALDVSEQVAVYSVVNTLIAATDMDKVEISIEGNKEVTFGQNMQLYKFYEWNDSLLAHTKVKKEQKK